MRARILRVHRRVLDRLRSWVTFGSRFAVDVTVANCRDWPPEVVVVLGVEYSDERVVEADCHERHESRAVGDTHLLRGRQLAQKGVIGLRTGHKPESRGFGLLGSSLQTDLSAILF